MNLLLELAVTLELRNQSRSNTATLPSHITVAVENIAVTLIEGSVIECRLMNSEGYPVLLWDQCPLSADEGAVLPPPVSRASVTR